MRGFVFIVIAGIAAACGDAKAPPPAAPVRPASKCAHVADHLLSLLSPTAREAPTEEVDRVRAQFKLRCVDDGWSLVAQECFLNLTAREEVQRCASMLTEEQMRALEQPVAAE